jgi:beta-glucosidase
VNEAGLDFYGRLVDELLANGITPYPTLYHWDLPQPLEDVGGWRVRDTAGAFAEYTERVVGRLGDRVQSWVTLNEPFVSAWIGYGWGHHAPGLSSRRDALAAGHHLLLAHALAGEVIRRDAPGAQLGIVLDVHPMHPASDSPEDAAAALELDGSHNRWFLDPLFHARYPGDVLERFAPDAPPVEDGDLAQIAAPLNFVGVNTYTRQIIRADPDGGGPVHVYAAGAPHTDKGWEVYPDCLHEVLVRLKDDYAPAALYITENGAAFGDVRDHDGHVRDPERLAYLESHIAAVGRAIEDGAPVKGYFVWSLLDNFEWADGYSKRFGIVYVDYPTLERVPKESFRWYRDFISAQHAPEPASGTEGPG